MGVSGTLVAHPPNKKSLDGLWNLVVKVQGMPGTISAVSDCKDDGSLTYVQSARNRLEVGKGTWKLVAPGKFMLTFVIETHDKAGAIKGLQRVQGTATLSGNGVNGNAMVQSLNRDGSVVYSGTAEVVGHRVYTSSRLTAVR